MDRIGATTLTLMATFAWPALLGLSLAQRIVARAAGRRSSHWFALLACLTFATPVQALSYSMNCSVGGSTTTGAVVASFDPAASTNTVNISNVATGTVLAGQASTGSFSTSIRVEPIVAGTSTSVNVGASYYTGISGFSITVLDGANFTGLQITLTVSGGVGSAENWRLTCPGTQTLSLVAGSSQSTAINTGFVTPLQARLTTNTGAPVPGATITFAGPPSGPTAFISSIVWTTDSSGMISVPATANGVTGSYALTASTPAAASPVTFNLTNTLQSSQTITFAKPADVMLTSGAMVALQATASSGLAVTFTSTTTGICTVTGSSAVLHAPGLCAITAAQAGNSGYTTAPTVTQSFNVLGTPKLALAVTASPAMIGAVGQTVIYTYTVSNAGNVPMSGVGVTDTRVSSISCPVTNLAVGAAATCSGTTVSSAADIAARGISSTAIVRATFNNTPIVSASVVTTVGIDVSVVQAATKSAIHGFLNQRGNLLTTIGPDSTRIHDRLSDGALFGGAGSEAGDNVSNFSAQRPFSSSPFQAVPAIRSSVGMFGAGSVDRDPVREASTIFDRFTRGGVSGRPTSHSSDFAFGTPAREDTDPQEGRSAPLPFRFSGNADNGMGRLAFSASLSQLRAVAEQKERDKLAALNPASSGTLGLGQGAALQPKEKPNAFDLWVEGTASYFTTDRIDGKRSGHAAVMMAGADYVVRPGLLIGLMAQLDWMSDAASNVQTMNRSGQGWMAGPYAGMRLTSNLYFDTRIAWGRSSNEVDPLGAYTDSFMTSRMLASAKLTGDWSQGAWRFRPSIEYVHFSETQKAYMNAIGIDIASQPFNLSRLLFGPEISYRMALADGTVLEPSIALKGIWDISKSDELTAAGTPIASGDLRGRLETGASMRMPSGVTLRASGAYDGIGATGGYHAVQGRAQVVVPLQ